jgi:hypothetical protein
MLVGENSKYQTHIYVSTLWHTTCFACDAIDSLPTERIKFKRSDVNIIYQTSYAYIS